MFRPLWRLLTAPPSIRLGVLLNLLVFGITPAYGHLAQGAECFQFGMVKKLGEDTIVEGNGLYAEHYDTNGDGRVDVMTLSHVKDTIQKNGKVVIIHSLPVFYLVDKDHDGEPDAIYIDKLGKGKCSDIVLYEDLTRPHDTGLNFQHPQMEMGREI